MLFYLCFASISNLSTGNYLIHYFLYNLKILQGCIPQEVSPCCCYRNFMQRDTTKLQCCRMSMELVTKMKRLNCNTAGLSFCKIK